MRAGRLYNNVRKGSRRQVALCADMRGGMAPYIPMAPVPLADTSLTGIVLETLLEAF